MPVPLDELERLHDEEAIGGRAHGVPTDELDVLDPERVTGEDGVDRTRTEGVLEQGEVLGSPFGHRGAVLTAASEGCRPG